MRLLIAEATIATRSQFRAEDVVKTRDEVRSQIVPAKQTALPKLSPPPSLKKFEPILSAIDISNRE